MQNGEKSLNKEYIGDLPTIHCLDGRQMAPPRFLSPDVPQGPFWDLKGSLNGWDCISVREFLPSGHEALVSHPAEDWAWQCTHLLFYHSDHPWLHSEIWASTYGLHEILCKTEMSISYMPFKRYF